MITHLGRVVYDRVQHRFTAKAISRILWSEVKEMGPTETGFFVSEVLARIIGQWITDPAGLLAFARTLLDEMLGIAGTVEIAPDLPPNSV